MSQQLNFDNEADRNQPQTIRPSTRRISEDTEIRMTADHNESLRTQLVQLNERARWYSTQLWQVPFAFLGIVAVATGLITNKVETLIAGLVFLGLSGLGIATLVHINGLREGQRRAVLNIQKIEERLHLEQTVSSKSPISRPLRIIVLVATIVLLLLGIVLLLSHFKIIMPL